MFSFIFLISQKICLESLIKERIKSFAKYWKLRLLWPKNKVKSLFFLPFNLFFRFLAKTSGEHHKKSQLGLFFGTLLLNIYFKNISRALVHLVSWVTYDPKFLPTIQCQVGLYFLSNSFLMYAAISFSMLYFSSA